MPSLYTVGPTVNSGLIESADINQIINTLSGNQNTPLFIKNTDPISFTLSLQNTDPASKALLLTAADGSTVLFRAQGSGVVASPDGTVGAPIVTTTHAQTLTNKILTNPIINSGGLQVTGGNIAIGGAPLSNVGYYATGSIHGPSPQGLAINPTLVAAAASDNLYGIECTPTFNDNGQTGVAHWGLYMGAGNNYLAANTGIGVTPGGVQRLFVRGATADSGSDALLTQNSSGTNLLEVRDDGYILFANGARYIDNGGSIRAFYLTTTDGSNGICQAGNGSLYLRSAGGANGILMDTGTGGLNVNSGGPINCAGYIAAGPAISAGAGDLNANRNNGTGYLFLANGSHYVGFDGTNYQMPTSGLNVGGNVNATSLSVASAPNSPAANIALPQTLGSKICLYDAGGGNMYGFGMQSAEMYATLPTGSTPRFRMSNGQVFGWMASQANISDWKFDCGNAFFNAVPNGTNVIAIGFNAAFAQAPTSVVYSINNLSGGRSSYNLIHLGADGIGTSGFNLVIDNSSGGSESFSVGWMAFGR